MKKKPHKNSYGYSRNSIKICSLLSNLCLSFFCCFVLNLVGVFFVDKTEQWDYSKTSVSRIRFAYSHRYKRKIKKKNTNKQYWCITTDKGRMGKRYYNTLTLTHTYLCRFIYTRGLRTFYHLLWFCMCVCVLCLLCVIFCCKSRCHIPSPNNNNQQHSVTRNSISHISKNDFGAFNAIYWH